MTQLRLTLKLFLYLLLGGLAFPVSADDPPGFISIDCGSANGFSIIWNRTGLKYISDEGFIDSGTSRFVSLEYQQRYPVQSQTLRSFPEGNRNCYKVNITRGTKYLIRAFFLYGNYDGKNMTPTFDLYLGAELWDSVSSPNLNDIEKEIIHVPHRNYVHICLVKTGPGIPFISTLLFRPLDDHTYEMSTPEASLLKIQRIDAGSGTSYRYPYDIYDRIWVPLKRDWTSFNTSSNISDLNSYQIPQEVMKTAARPKNADYLDISLTIPTDVPDNTSELSVYMHFAEIEELKSNGSRELEIFHNGNHLYGPFSTSLLSAITIYSQLAVVGGVHEFKISKTPNSTLPPIINAWEIYSVRTFLQSETDQNDANAMRVIKSTYGIKRNWQGDPCLPKVHAWEGINCSYDDDNQQHEPRVISLNLSSSGLTGNIPPSIADLKEIKTLDLSNNSLRGSIPDFLSKLPNLTFVNLENNDLTGLVPVELIKKSKDVSFSLRVCGNPNISSTISCEIKQKKKSTFTLPVVALVVSGTLFVVASATAAIWFWRALKRKRQRDAQSIFQTDESLESTERKFKYREIVNITNNFEKILGQGGFGKVYYGRIDNTEVAVKMLSAASVQGFRQFRAEVDLLWRVHHKNLTGLVGYCNDKDNKALIYEYMANGNLHQHLSGSSNILKWEDRLLIAVDAAQGLEYLHYGCKPSIIHRDVKTTNILLNENFQAKISDFGLSRNVPECKSHVSTLVAGTPGYLDPEYCRSLRTNEKSDVYSFGVVLLEIITGRSPSIPKSLETDIHISQWVNSLLEEGRITSIVDSRLDGNFDINSVWKVVEIAMKCTSHNSTERPTMSQVVRELKECLQMEANQKNEAFDGSMSFCSADISISSAR